MIFFKKIAIVMAIAMEVRMEMRSMCVDLGL